MSGIVYQAPGFDRELKAEYRKLRGRKAGFIPLAFLVFMFLWSFWIVRNPTPEELACGYDNMLYQYSMMNTILMPVMIAVIASRICDMEIKGDTLKILFTLQRRNHFFDCKLIMGFLHMMIYVIGQEITIVVFGKIFGFTQPVPVTNLIWHLCITSAVGSALLLLQQILSLFFDNQILPMIVGLAGTFLGLFSLFFPAWLTRLVLWGYFAVFCSIRMEWDKATRIVSYYKEPYPICYFLGFLAVLAAAWYLCRKFLQQKEV